MPEVQTYARGDRDTKLVTVMIYGTHEAARKVASRRKVRAPILLDPERKLEKRFGVSFTPITFVLDRTGHARAALLGGQTQESLKKAISRLRE